jgi:predicted 3-demethylubiquinone-9 3-methyltransferase (glyoxalase superfamily)
MPTAKNTICLWYDKDAEAAARFYATDIPDSSVGRCTSRARRLSRPARRATC